MAIKAGCDGSFEGFCCRMVIETKRVFDGCAFTDENITLALTSEEPIPQGAVFEAARIISSELLGYTVNGSTDGCYRVCGDILTTFAVTYSYGGTLTTVRAGYRESRQFLLRLPQGNSLVPYSIEVQSTMNVSRGAIQGTNSVSVSGCLLQIVKVTAPVDILIPTYGYCKYPPCTGCVCNGINTRIFPSFNNE